VAGTRAPGIPLLTDLSIDLLGVCGIREVDGEALTLAPLAPIVRVGKNISSSVQSSEDTDRNLSGFAVGFGLRCALRLSARRRSWRVGVGDSEAAMACSSRTLCSSGEALVLLLGVHSFELGSADEERLIMGVPTTGSRLSMS
jgi:hypothetical protein